MGTSNVVRLSKPGLFSLGALPLLGVNFAIVFGLRLLWFADDSTRVIDIIGVLAAGLVFAWSLRLYDRVRTEQAALEVTPRGLEITDPTVFGMRETIPAEAISRVYLGPAVEELCRERFPPRFFARRPAETKPIHLHRFSGYPNLLIELRRAGRFRSALQRRAPYAGTLPSNEQDVRVLWGSVPDLDGAVRSFREAMPDVLEVAAENDEERRKRHRGRISVMLKASAFGALVGLVTPGVAIVALLIGGPLAALAGILVVLVGFAGFARWRSS